MELSKSDKKIARQIIEKGLDKHFAEGLKKFDNILSKWKANVRNNRESYHLLYKSIDNFDKRIADLYDRMTGSNYIFIIAGQLYDGFVDVTDLDELSEQVRAAIIMIYEG